MDQKTENQTEQTSSGFAGEGQASGTELRPGWNRPLPETLPEPTYWPLVLAVGILFALGGIVTFHPISLVGLFLIGTAMAGWVGDLRHEHTN